MSVTLDGADHSRADHSRRVPDTCDGADGSMRVCDGADHSTADHSRRVPDSGRGADGCVEPCHVGPNYAACTEGMHGAWECGRQFHKRIAFGNFIVSVASNQSLAFTSCPPTLLNHHSRSGIAH